MCNSAVYLSGLTAMTRPSPSPLKWRRRGSASVCHATSPGGGLHDCPYLVKSLTGAHTSQGYFITITRKESVIYLGWLSCSAKRASWPGQGFIQLKVTRSLRCSWAYTEQRHRLIWPCMYSQGTHILANHFGISLLRNGIKKMGGGYYINRTMERNVVQDQGSPEQTVMATVWLLNY